MCRGTNSYILKPHPNAFLHNGKKSKPKHSNSFKSIYFCTVGQPVGFNCYVLLFF